MTERDRRFDSSRAVRQESEINFGQISRLCSVVRLTGGRRSELAYLGWTIDGKPMVVSSQSELSLEAKRSLEQYRSSRLPIKEVNFESLKVVEHVSVADPIDFRDIGRKKAEDLVNFVVRDNTGTRTISLGEIGILQGIVQAGENPWQDNSVPSKSGSVSARTMYSVFVPENTGDRSAIAIIFNPIVEGESNKSVFNNFVRQTLTKLLFLDEMQDEGNRKGYIEKAAELTEAKPTGGISDLFLALRALRLVEFDDAWLEELRRKSRNVSSFILGIFFKMDEDQTARRNLPRYSVDSMELDRLLLLARNMLFVAQRQII